MLAWSAAKAVNLRNNTIDMSIQWRQLQDLAVHVHPQTEAGIPFPDRLPLVSACNMDAVKGDVCRLRAGGWCSVDAVTIGADGRIYFIEFKDESRNQAAGLRKKAFDSLALFKIRFAPKLSFCDISECSVFVLVRPDAQATTSPSLDLDRLFQEDSATKLPLALEYQLDELRTQKLYADVKILSSSSLQDLFFRCRPAVDENEFCQRLSLLRPSRRAGGLLPSCVRELPLGQLLQDSSGCSVLGESGPLAVDFRGAAKTLLELRMMRPYERFQHARGRWFVCEAYCADTCELCAYQDIGPTTAYPLATLVNTAFDSAILADWIFGVRCSYTLRYGGGSGLTFSRPGNGVASFVSDFWESYHGWFERGSFGLEAFHRIGWYSSVQVLSVDR